MVKTAAPELKGCMDKRLRLELNAGRAVVGVLRGYDAFMNVNLADAQDVSVLEEPMYLGQAVIRGNSIVAIESLEPVE
ncbi:hypothetical protein GGF46_001151 [Coemansia sp. RSA 552]|nr:hypothetical protein GGF46_001151 [Coemansia sp. RSA 552]